MKIQTTPNLQLNSKQQQPSKAGSNPSFKGAEFLIPALNFLETNQALGASFVDVACMGVPRTLTDFSRGPEAGTETMRREFSSTIVDALIGAYGVGAAYLISQGFNKDFGVKGHKMFMSDDALDIYNKAWESKKGSTDQVTEFLNHIVDNTKGFNTEREATTGWVGIDDKAKENFVKKLAKEIKEGPDSISKETRAFLENVFADATGAEKQFKLEIKKGEESIKSVSSLGDYIDNLYKVSKALAKNEGKNVESAFFKGLKGINYKASIAGIAIATVLGCSLQPVNMYLTKKKTGKSGFVGVEGREPDNSKGFKALKAFAAAAAGLGVLATIGKPSEIISKIKFKGFFPTIPQYKFVYGFTIVSRLLSARDKNELRESSIKDSLGFVNWLILGGFVSKGVAAALEKMDKFKDDKFIRYSKEEHNTKFKWLVDAPIVSRKEVLHTALKNMEISTIKPDGVAMTFKEMMGRIAEEAPKSLIAKNAKSKIKYLGLIQAAGYIYSGVVLGVGIPKLNIAITNSIEKKRKAKLDAEKAKTSVATAETQKTQQKAV